RGGGAHGGGDERGADRDDVAGPRRGRRGDRGGTGAGGAHATAADAVTEPRRRRGRRPGRQNTREAVLKAAREAFAEAGYDRTSVRQVAAAAGVDTALVHHYFGTKEQLFQAVVEFPVDLP